MFVLRSSLVCAVTPFLLSVSFQQRLSVIETLFQIGNLKESTVYCFSVQVQLEIFSGHLLGEQSAPECHSTALSGTGWHRGGVGWDRSPGTPGLVLAQPGMGMEVPAPFSFSFLILLEMGERS